MAGSVMSIFKTNQDAGTGAPIVRVGANLQVLKGTFLRASFGQGFRYPTITERYISTKAGLFGVFPNPGLEPEKSNNVEVGVKQGFRIGGVMGFLDIAAFRQHYEHTIEYLFGTWEPTVALVGFKFLNTGTSLCPRTGYITGCNNFGREQGFWRHFHGRLYLCAPAKPYTRLCVCNHQIGTARSARSAAEL